MKSGNLFIRPIEHNDLDKLHEWRNNFDIFSQLGGGYLPTSKTEMQNWMENFSKLDKNNFRFIIECQNNNVGFISLTNINYINRNADLGIYIGETEYQGQGIATEALKIIQDFAKNTLNLRKIKLRVSKNNPAAIRLYKKNNYKVVGEMADEWFIDGKWTNVYIMELFLFS
jgi:RimJ/RimL family protein N-acetyltransferase